MREKGKPNVLKQEEITFIRLHCMDHTDAWIATQLKRDIRTVVSARRKLGIRKVNAGRSITPKALPEKPLSKEYSESHRKQFFMTTLANSLYHDNLKEQFTTKELDYYLEEWGSLCIQFEDILATEKRQIDEYIKAQIMGNRMLRNIKVAEEEIGKMQQEVEQFRANHDMNTDEEAQERDIQLINMIRTMHAQCQVMANDYQKNVELKNEILGELNGRRKDRIDSISKRGTTFIGLIQEFRDRETREIQGKHMELMRLAKEKKKEEWSKPILFADGSKDCVLMDENSKLNDLGEEIATPSPMIDKFIKQRNKNIIIIDDDASRCQIFGELFKRHNLEFASSSYKAIKLLERAPEDRVYDLICLEYDLGVQEKGTEFCKYIIENIRVPTTSILIHSMNNKGVLEMYEILSKTDTRPIEVYNFENILKIYKPKPIEEKTGDENATDSANSETA